VTSSPKRCFAWLALLVSVAIALVACRAGNGETGSPSPTGGQAQGSPDLATRQPLGSPSPKPDRTELSSPRIEPQLPEITEVSEMGAQAIPAPESADWIVVDFGRAWVSGVGDGIGFYEVQTGLLQGSVPVPQSPCAGMDTGFGALWTATCEERGVARIDPQTGQITDWAAVDVPAEGESSVGAGEGAIWSIADGEACSGCVLVRIDPTDVEITSTFDVPEGGTAVRAGLGGIWITYVEENQVLRVDPDTGEVVSAIEVGSGPRFLAVGEGAVWVMNQAAGSVSHVDPTTNMVVATIEVDGEAIFGGDVMVGDGFVWLRGSHELVAQIDPVTDRVVARIGSPQASGGVDAGDGQLWIAGHFEESDGWHAVLYRIPLVDG